MLPKKDEAFIKGNRAASALLCVLFHSDVSRMLFQDVGLRPHVAPVDKRRTLENLCV